MGLFTPKWVKDAGKAEEAVRFANQYQDLKTLYQMALKCELPGIRAKAIRGLKAHGDLDRGRQYLSALIREGVTAHDRCLAAALYGDKKIMQATFQNDLAKANQENPEPEWFYRISDHKTLSALYPRVKEKKDRKKILDDLTEPAYLAAIAETENSEDLLTEIVQKLSGHQDTLRDTVIRTRNMAFVSAALPFINSFDRQILSRLSELVQSGALKDSLAVTAEKLSAEPELLSAALQKTPRSEFIRYALPHATDRDLPVLGSFLEDPSKKDLWPVIARAMIRIDPHGAMETVFYKLSEEEQLNAIRSHLVSKAILLEKAKGWRYSDKVTAEALHQITDPKDAMSLMTSGYIFQGSCPPGELRGYDYLAGIAAGDPKGLTDLLLTGGIHFQAPAYPVIVQHIDDQDQLLRLAGSDNIHVNSEAVRKLYPLNIKVIREKLTGKARNAADERYFSYALTNPPELLKMTQDEILEAYQWARGSHAQGTDKMCLNAASALRDEALAKALQWEIMRGPNANNQKQIDVLLSGVQRGDDLIPFAFYEGSADPSLKPVINRIRELAKTDPGLKERFTDAAVKEMSSHLSASKALAEYDHISEPEAEWKYGGKPFIRLLTDVLNAKERSPYEAIPVHEAAQHLGEIYKWVIESQSILGPYRGKTYLPHHDYPSPSCGSEHDDFTERVITDW